MEAWKQGGGNGGADFRCPKQHCEDQRGVGLSEFQDASNGLVGSVKVLPVALA